MNHRKSYTGKDSRDSERNAVRVPAEKFNTGTNGSRTKTNLNPMTKARPGAIPPLCIARRFFDKDMTFAGGASRIACLPKVGSKRPCDLQMRASSATKAVRGAGEIQRVASWLMNSCSRLSHLVRIFNPTSLRRWLEKRLDWTKKIGRGPDFTEGETAGAPPFQSPAGSRRGSLGDSSWTEVGERIGFRPVI